MFGTGEVVGLISLAGQAAGGARNLYATIEAYGSAPEQAEQIANDCTRLSDILYQIQLAATIDLPTNSLAGPRDALHAAVSDCRDKIAGIQQDRPHPQRRGLVRY